MFNSSHADKVKIAQLEAANASMKQMLDKLVGANADLEGQQTHLIQLLGRVTAENTLLKRNRDAFLPQPHNGFDVNVERADPPSVSSVESGHQESLPRKVPLKKRHRMLSDN